MKTALQTYNIIPRLMPVGFLLLGLILGFIWTYSLSPNVYTSAEPVNLGDSWKQEYVKQVAWQFAASGDQANATKQLSALGNAKDVLTEMLNNASLTGDPNLGPRLQALAPFTANDPNQLGKIAGGLFNSNITPILCLVLLALVVGGPIVLFAIVPFSAVVALLPGRRSHGPTTVVEGLDKQRREAVAAATAAQQAGPAPTPSVAGVQGDPMARSMSTYLLNDDTYDDSFSIETPAGKFLGEMGGGISKVLGPDKPKKVSAFEIWVFDTIDTRTMTKVLASEYAFNDPGIRQELSAKGELVLAKPGAIVTLETQALLVQARVIDVSYGTGNTPPNSFFDRLTFELSAWPKANAGAPPAGAPVMAAPSGAPAPFAATPQPPPPPPPGSDPYSSDTTRMAPR
ncbi:MAG: hypothetical protein ACYDBJ_13790 [Aggregatilineales bacterium]